MSDYKPGDAKRPTMGITEIRDYTRHEETRDGYVIFRAAPWSDRILSDIRIDKTWASNAQRLEITVTMIE